MAGRPGKVEVLLVKGWLGTKHWGLPGGGLHRREVPVNGALRELREETGLKLQSKDLKFLYKGSASHYGLSFRYHCFAAELSQKPDTRKQLLEITDVAWWPLDSVKAQMVTKETWQALTAWRKV